MNACLDRCADHQLADAREGAGAVDDDGAALEHGPQSGRVVDRGDPNRATSQLFGEVLQPLPAAAAENHLEMATNKLGGDERAGEPGGTVQDDHPLMVAVRE